MDRLRNADPRLFVDAIQHMLASSCQRCLVPASYPPISTVRNYIYPWSRSGGLERIQDSLRAKARAEARR
ncbi:MAG: transposase [Albidovulum sp.]|nr:transposase [Albidovulum sp.]